MVGLSLNFEENYTLSPKLYPMLHLPILNYAIAHLTSLNYYPLHTLHPIVSYLLM